MGLREELSTLDRDETAQVAKTFMERINEKPAEGYAVGLQLAADYPALSNILFLLQERFAPNDTRTPEASEIALQGAAAALGIVREIAETQAFNEHL